MMGIKNSSGKLFYGFSLEDRVPEKHLLRSIDDAIDFSFIRKIAEPFYSHTGAPSIDPIVVLKMALLGYLYGIASERKLAEECRLNMAFLWFLGYDVDELPPDHSILSKCRGRFGKAVYVEFFREIVKQCQANGLIEGGTLYMDSTLLQANASLDSLVSRSLYEQLERRACHYVDDLWMQNAEDEPDDDCKPPANKLTANQLKVSKTDPDAMIVRRKDTKPFLGHKVHIGVDGGNARIVTAVTVTTGTVRETLAAPTVLDEHIKNTESIPDEVVGDKGYSSKAFYRHLLEQDIMPSIPRARPWRKRRSKLLKSGFKYDAERDVYTCPMGKTLYRLADDNGHKVYQVHRLACRRCPNHGKLCKAKRPTITRPLDEYLDDQVSQHLESSRAKRSIRLRKIFPETVFGEMKNFRGLRKANLRRQWRVSTQAYMALAAHNILQIVRSLRRPRPAASYTLVTADNLSAAFAQSWLFQCCLLESF